MIDPSLGARAFEWGREGEGIAMEMTAELRIKRELILLVYDSLELDAPVLDTPEQVVAAWDNRENSEELYDQFHDTESEFREGDVETDIACESSRHYESRSVARLLRDGTWVGWTYWYGGGKHGEPDSIDWMQDAYELNVTEEEKQVVVRTFAKRK